MTQPAPPAHAVDRLVPMVHVDDVARSLEFYARLGFAADSTLQDDRGRTFWASACSGAAQIMFAQSSAPIVPEAQAVILYMYAADVAALRERLLRGGVHDGGEYCGKAGPNGGRRVVFEVARPDYMPAGELRIADDDGYCILVGQHDPP